MYYLVREQDLEAIADTIREKTGKSARLRFPEDFIAEIQNMSPGADPLSVPVLTVSNSILTLSSTDDKTKGFDLYDENGTYLVSVQI